MLLGTFMLSSLPALEAVAEDSKPIDDDKKYAWSSNAGWLNFRPPPEFAETVKIYPDHLEGYLWGENIGWIKLGSYSDGEEHTYQNTSQDNWGVNNDGSGKLSGYAWSTNVGWINFDPECNDCPASVTINPTTGNFEGYAWSETVEWINFQSVYGVNSPTNPYLALIPETGAGGDDSRGLPWPVPRFTDNSNGTVTDNQTGLIWLKDASCSELTKNDGEANWEEAKSAAQALETGTCGLNDNSEAGDWYLPSVRELHSLIHFRFQGPALPNTDGTGQWVNDSPFLDVKSDDYWSITPNANDADAAWYVNFDNGQVSITSNTRPFYVWPVRGGLQE